MKQTKLIMGMPISIEIVDARTERYFSIIFDYFHSVDARFSTYKSDSEISQINRGLPKSRWSKQMRLVMELCEQTKQSSDGYFDIFHDGSYDPSGLVKGWAINNAAIKLVNLGARGFFIEAGGDIQVHGVNGQKFPWRVGIRNPFNTAEIVKTLQVASEGVATSGTYIRGQHIYNPKRPADPIKGVASLTVIGPNIFEADRFATAAFAMGKTGINFIESMPGLEGYLIDDDGIATYTSGFERYMVS
ncbi:MAG TPA: FAD:protein FMN transferase [Candidatus Saccharimonadales bacterium]|nr:FAD:protein FMN transferase [Candidatus Saccharimonadales bacterium]